MAKKYLYLGGNKWCYTKDCSEHAEQISMSNIYASAHQNNDQLIMKSAEDILRKLPNGNHIINHTKTRILANQLGYKPVISLDLDGTVYKLTEGFREVLAIRRRIPRDKWLEAFPDPEFYDFHQGDSAWFSSREDFIKNFQVAERDGVYSISEPYEGATETMRELNNYGFRIKSVTARSSEYNVASRQWLISRDFDVEDVYHFGHAKEESGADVYFEDAPAVINRLTGLNKPVVVKNQRYNEDIDSPLTRRVHKWNADDTTEAVFDLLDKKRKERRGV